MQCTDCGDTFTDEIHVRCPHCDWLWRCEEHLNLWLATQQANHREHQAELRLTRQQEAECQRDGPGG